MGFTVSLFVAGLAFPNRELEAAANVGITIVSAARRDCRALLSSGEGIPREPTVAGKRGARRILMATSPRSCRRPHATSAHNPRSNSEPRSILRIPATKPVTIGSR